MFYWPQRESKFYIILDNLGGFPISPETSLATIFEDKNWFGLTMTFGLTAEPWKESGCFPIYHLFYPHVNLSWQ